MVQSIVSIGGDSLMELAGHRARAAPTTRKPDNEKGARWT
jgi:hypothetical protein